MSEKNYIAVDSSDRSTYDLVRMLNPYNEFRGRLVTANPNDKNDWIDVRDLFLAHVKVDGKNIQAYTDGKKRIVDISPHVELSPVTVNGEKPEFSKWTITPSKTPDLPGKRLVARMRDDNKWVVSVIEREPSGGRPLTMRDITCGKGGESSLELRWEDEEIDYQGLTSIEISRRCPNLYGFRLGDKDGMNEGKILQPAMGGGGGGGSIQGMIPDTSGLKDIGKLEQKEEQTLLDVIDKLNYLIGKVELMARTQTTTPVQN